MTKTNIGSRNLTFSFTCFSTVDYSLLCILTIQINHYVSRRVELAEVMFVL